MPVPPLLGTLESALYADDLDAARAFYNGILGLPVVACVEGRHVFFRIGSGVLLLFRPSETEQPARNPALPVPTHGARGPGHFCFAVAADALDAWRNHLDSAGIAIEADFRWPNGARSLYVRDPAGNSVEFADPALWS